MYYLIDCPHCSFVVMGDSPFNAYFEAKAHMENSIECDCLPFLDYVDIRIYESLEQCEIDYTNALIRNG